MTPLSTPLSSDVRAEAAVWVARLHSSSRSTDVEAGFRLWLSADPKHAEAFDLATRAWDLGGSIPAGRFPRIVYPVPGKSTRITHRFLRPAFGVAAALCLAVISAAVFIYNDRTTVATAVGEQRMLTLDDGSRIFLNTDTKLSVHFDSEHRRVRLEKGEALFDVAKDSARPFLVDAGTREVRAVGTEFVVRRDSRQVAVTLVEGKVRVSSEDLGERAEAGGAPEPEFMVAGQRLTFVENRPPASDQPPLEAVTAWRRGEVVLDKTRLGDAVEEMNRYSKIKLVVGNPSAADIRLSGIFRAGDSSSFAKAVAETYHLALNTETRRIVLSGAYPP